MRTKRTLVGVSIAILLAATTLLASSGGAATPAARSASVQAGADWLAARFTADGFIPDVNDDPDFSNTAQSALSLAASASHQSTFDAAVAFLQAHVDDYVGAPGGDDSVGALGYLLLLADVAGVPGTDFGGQNLVARLQATLGDFEPGLYGATDPTFDGAFREGLAILGLVSQGVAPDVSATTWLTDQQCTSGGWEAYRADTSVPCGPPDPVNFIGPDSNSTALALSALAAENVAPPNDALGFLDATQDADGGWAFILGVDVDPNSTALVIQALIAAGEDPESAPWLESGGSPYDSLMAWQINEGDPADVGGFATPFSDGFPDQFASQQAVWGLAGLAFPFGPVDFDGPDEPTTSTTTSTTPPGVSAEPAGDQATHPQFAGRRKAVVAGGPPPPVTTATFPRVCGCQPATAEPTLLNLLDAFLPRNVMATMHTTAMSATSRAYSTSEAPRSVLQRLTNQARVNS